MTREQQIEHWADIVRAVFKAEDAVKEEWYPKLQAVKGAGEQERGRVADGFCRAIATEIIDHGGGAFENIEY